MSYNKLLHLAAVKYCANNETNPTLTRLLPDVKTSSTGLLMYGRDMYD